MYVVATFRYSKNIEIAIADLENMGLENKQILVLPLDKRNAQKQVFDSIYQSDGQSYVDMAAILGMIFMLLGGIYGFVLKWGPILWALIGLIAGVSVGFIIRFIYNKVKNKDKNQSVQSDTEVVMIIQCNDLQDEKVKKIVWNHIAIGVATFKN